MSDIAMGAALLRLVQEAFNLGDRPIRHMVIDIDCMGACKIFFEEFVEEDKLDRLAGFLRNLPSVDPGVRWVERIKVQNGQGATVEVKGVEQEDERERQLARDLFQRWKYMTEEQKLAVEDFVSASTSGDEA